MGSRCHSGFCPRFRNLPVAWFEADFAVIFAEFNTTKFSRLSEVILYKSNRSELEDKDTEDIPLLIEELHNDLRLRTAGEIATHIANIPGVFIASLKEDEFDRNKYQAPAVDHVSDIVQVFEKNISHALELLQTLTEGQLFASWRYKYGEEVIFEMPRFAVIRGMGLNHLIHHRGQLSVYLRLLDIPLPPVYGPTADKM